MKEGYTHITVILDRTGSMEAIRDDTIGGFNAFLEEQQRLPGEVTLTLVQFDSQNPYELIHHRVPIDKVPRLTRETYVPRAMTPLLDALGRGIIDLENTLVRLPEEQRPERVVMAVITDGQENASREFTRRQITAMIEAKQALLGWQFVFLSADLQAIKDAIRSGVRDAQAMAFDHTGEGVRAAMQSFSTRFQQYQRRERADVSFEQEDRDRQASERQRRQGREGA